MTREVFTMFVLEQLKNQKHFSPSQKIIADYLLAHLDTLDYWTTAKVAEATYTTPSSVVRLAQKLGYSGWKEMNHALIHEASLREVSPEINPNQPFASMDSLMNITANVAELEIRMIRQTQKMLEHDQLQQAVQVIKNAQHIYIFALANTSSCVQSFAYNMRKIFKPVILVNNRDDFGFYMNIMTPQDAALYLSYSGKSFTRFNLIRDIQMSTTPSISITSYHSSLLREATKIHLYLPDVEHEDHKVGHFMSHAGFHYILDVLYGAVYQSDFHKNTALTKKYLADTNRILETGKE